MCQIGQCSKLTMDRGRKRVFMLLHVLLLLPVLGGTCSSRSATVDSATNCDSLLLTHVCHITAHHNIAGLLSNDTVWTCTNESYSSVHLTPDCCSQHHIERDDVVVILTSHVTTKIDCALVSAMIPTFNYEYGWGIAAPLQWRVLLKVPRYDVHNTIRATDELDGYITHPFSCDSFTTDGDSFISSSHLVNMNVIFTDSAGMQDFTVIGQTFNVTDVVNGTRETKDCSFASSVDSENQWDNDPDCERDGYTFDGSCYWFSRGEESLSTSRLECNAMSDYHLVFIESAEEQLFLATTASSIDRFGDYWIGIERDDNWDQVWMDGSPITYSNFERKRPGQCFGLRSSRGYVWQRRSCSLRDLYICEREQGYHGSNASHEGCYSFKGTLPPSVSNEGAILIKFSYTIKTYQGVHDEQSTVVWTGNYINECLPENDQSFYQNGLQVNVFCSESLNADGETEVTFQAKGIGLVQIRNVQLLIYQREADGPSSTTEPARTTASLGTSSLATGLSNHEMSSAPKSTIIAVVVVLLIALLVAGVIGVIWYKKRRKSATSKQKTQSKSLDGDVINPTFQNDNCEEHEYAEFTNSIKSPSEAIPPTKSLEDVQQHEYAELPGELRDHAYQNLRKDNDDYTALDPSSRLQSKAPTDEAAQPTDHEYQALHVGIPAKASH